MSDDWQIGDLAVCVDDSPRTIEKLRGTPFPIRAGSVRRVVGLGLSREEPYSLFLEGERACDQDRGYGFGIRRFRKIRPDEPSACEEEFVRLLNRSKHGVSA